MLTPTEHQTPANMRAHFKLVAVLIGTVIVLYSPVLLHAHWGSFDDPSLILQSSRRLMDDPSTISYILAAQLRMGIYYWVTVLWRLFPENPTGFFATNCLLISTAVTLLYSICFRLTGNARLSVLSAAAVLASPSLFEVIYTLDKQEVYLPFLFSMVILVHLLASKCRMNLLPVFALVSALCSTGCYLSKETGVILCLFSATLLICNLFYGKTKKLEVMLRSGAMLVATLAPLLVLKWFIFPTLADHYVVMTFEAQKLLAKTWQYALVVPDFFLLLVYSCMSAVYLAFSNKHAKTDDRWCAFAALLFVSVAATAALISFDTFAGVLLYIWLPIYFFLLPCMAYSLHAMPSAINAGSRINRIFVISYLLLLFSQIPTRFLQAQFQFSFDGMTSELAQKLSTLTVQSSDPVVCAMPTYSVGETEIPEQIETHVRSLLQKRYYETKSETTIGQKFSMLNYLSPDCENKHDVGDPANVYKLAQFRGKALSYTNECPPNYVGWTGFQILNGATPFQQWVKRPFGKGDLLIVPYGEVIPDKVLYRGAGIFAHPWSLKILNFPQMTLEDVGHVERKLINPIGHRQTMGWRILRIRDTAPVALDTSTDGWLKAGAKVHYRHSDDLPVLRIESNQPVAQALVLRQTGAEDEIVVPVKDKQRTIIDLPLQGRDTTGILTLKSLTDSGDNRVHVDQVEYVAKRSALKTPFLTTTEDGWLLNNGLLIYSVNQEDKKLDLTTTQDHAMVTVIDKSGNYNLNFNQGKASIALVNGKPLRQGFFYLQLCSAKPIYSKSERRQLLIHCDSYLVN